MSTDTRELEPCPFCGGENIRVTCTGGFWTAICGNWGQAGCGATSGPQGTEVDLVQHWNTRAPRSESGSR